MSRPLKFALAILILVICFVLFSLQKANGKLKEEQEYHSNLPRTIKLTSPQFAQDGRIPDECAGKEAVSPGLQWSNIPEGTRSLAIAVTDYDAPSPNFRLINVSHWVLYNIPVGVDSIPKAASPTLLKDLGISVGKNIQGKREYGGPRPPFGVPNYYFRVYALDFKSLYLTDDTKDELLHAMNKHILAYGELVGQY